MGWTTDDTPGHDGYFVGLTPARVGVVAITDDAWRPLTHEGDAARAAGGIYLRAVQIGCVCGWRSSRMEAPIAAQWRASGVDVPAWFEEQGRGIWRAHAIATVFADRESREAGHAIE